jgi:predicted molibdopterin-dependent oxidoreductase YjgC
MLAAELAYRLEADLGLESVEGIWDEIERVAPSHAGITRRLLESPAGSDGVLAPLRPEVAAAAEGTHVQITGVQGTQPDAMELARAAEQHESGAEPSGTTSPGENVEQAMAEAEPRQAEAAEHRPATIRFERGERYQAPKVDSYSLRLVASRKLYDNGTLVQHSPSLARLASGSTLLLSSHDLGQVGVSDGAAVRLKSSRAVIEYTARASHAVPRGTALMMLNQADADPALLIDATAPITEIRFEVIR